MRLMEKEDIVHLANLARISITNEEAEALKNEIASVLAYVSTVNEIARISLSISSMKQWATMVRRPVLKETCVPFFFLADITVHAMSSRQASSHCSGK